MSRVITVVIGELALSLSRTAAIDLAEQLERELTHWREREDLRREQEFAARRGKVQAALLDAGPRLLAALRARIGAGERRSAAVSALAVECGESRAWVELAMKVARRSARQAVLERVLHLVVQGRANADIAEAVGLSAGAVAAIIARHRAGVVETDTVVSVVKGRADPRGPTRSPRGEHGEHGEHGAEPLPFTQRKKTSFPQGGRKHPAPLPRGERESARGTPRT